MKENAVKEYNAILDLCRNAPQRKYNIELELGIDRERLGDMLLTLRKRNLIKTTPSRENSRIFEYFTTPNAVYYVYTKNDPKNDVKVNSKNIKVEGNVTTVTSGSYHTRGNKAKRSVWLGSTADM